MNTREGSLHVQLVDPVHQLRIGVRYRAWLAIRAAPADPWHDGLAAGVRLGRGIAHLLTLGNRPALPSAPDKNRSPASTLRSSHAGSSRP